MKGLDQFKLFSRQRGDIGTLVNEYDQTCIFKKLFWLIGGDQTGCRKPC